MNVHELLTMSHFKGMRLVAGESGKEREVQSVNMMDAPDIIDFLKENEFLVTTAYHLKDHPQTLTELVQAMSEHGCSALGIKTKRFLNEIPEDAIQLANELSFPIIELPLHLSLGHIVNETFQCILNKRAAELAFALETHKQFTDIIMKGKGIQCLLQNLSKMIDRSVHLIDQHSKPIYQLDTDLDFPSRLDGLMNQAAKTAISFSVVASRKTCTLFPVHISEKKGGFLVIGGQIDKADQCTSLTVEQAANVISFSLMKEHALRRHERSIRNDFFLHFLDGTFSSQEEIIGRAIEFSLQTDRKYICAVGKIEGTDYHPTCAERHEKADDIFDFIEGEVTNAVAKIHFFQKREACILLFEVQDNRTNLLTDAKSMLRQFQTRVSSCFENTVSFGISNLCHNFLHVKNAYKEAADALSLGQRSKKKEYIQTYQTKDIMELLRQIPQEDLKNYYSIALNGFTESKIDEEQTLLETLSVYLETHCQISETAKRLFVHRNTVVYRIEKCEEILGKSLKDSETTLQMRLAFRIKLLLTEK